MSSQCETTVFSRRRVKGAGEKDWISLKKKYQTVYVPLPTGTLDHTYLIIARSRRYECAINARMTTMSNQPAGNYTAANLLIRTNKM